MTLKSGAALDLLCSGTDTETSKRGGGQWLSLSNSLEIVEKGTGQGAMIRQAHSFPMRLAAVAFWDAVLAPHSSSRGLGSLTLCMLRNWIA